MVGDFLRPLATGSEMGNCYFKKKSITNYITNYGYGPFGFHPFFATFFFFGCKKIRFGSANPNARTQTDN